MTEPDWKAEILDDRTTPLAPPEPRAAPVALLPRRWRLAAIGAVVALAMAVVVLYWPDSAEVASVSATASPVTVVSIATAVPSPTPSPTPDEGPCRIDRVQIDARTDGSVPSWYGRAVVPAGDLAAFVVEDDANHGSVVVVGSAGVDEPRVVATYQTDQVRGGAYLSPIGWSNSGATLLVRADQFGGDDAPGCANLFLVNADGSGVRALTDFGPGESVYDAAAAPNSGLVAYSMAGEVRVIDPVVGERRVADCDTAWQLRWSPDEQKFLGICNEADLLVVDIPDRTAVRATLADGAVLGAAVWSDDGTSITVVATTRAPTGSEPLSVLDFSAATFSFEPRTSFPLPAGLGFATISPSGRWIVLQDTQEGNKTAALDVATGVTTTLPTPPSGDSYAGVPYAWEADGDTGLYADSGVLHAVNLPTATVKEVGIMPPYWFVWRNVPPP